MRLSVVTPSGSLLDQDVEEVAAPGVGGEFGVLAGHTPFLTALRPGILSWTQGGTSLRMAISTGYAEVSGDDRIVVVTTAAMLPDKVDVEKARQDLDEADKALAAWTQPESDSETTSLPRSVLEARRDYAQARLDLKSN